MSILVLFGFIFLCLQTTYLFFPPVSVNIFFFIINKIDKHKQLIYRSFISLKNIQIKTDNNKISRWFRQKNRGSFFFFLPFKQFHCEFEFNTFYFIIILNLILCFFLELMTVHFYLNKTDLIKTEDKQRRT